MGSDLVLNVLVGTVKTMIFTNTLTWKHFHFTIYYYIYITFII